ncbi:SDR family NAD(P)-dependent oxidoreductase [Streptomyces mirabilis]|uniref:SDR family NAD(P)-dependent oxidoreductase n=2 Tax=Streptomyces mirabilis TaxID=68239 RepID=UPI002E2D3B12|nr:SDR family oxidoreductase [Streptomyces mirabilis]
MTAGTSSPAPPASSGRPSPQPVLPREIAAIEVERCGPYREAFGLRTGCRGRVQRRCIADDPGRAPSPSEPRTPSPGSGCSARTPADTSASRKSGPASYMHWSRSSAPNTPSPRRVLPPTCQHRLGGDEPCVRTANDVPVWLRAIGSLNSETRRKALADFCSAAHRQGDVYACTTASLPFLFALADDPAAPDCASVVDVLLSIGRESVDRDDEIRLSLGTGRPQGIGRWGMRCAHGRGPTLRPPPRQPSPTAPARQPRGPLAHCAGHLLLGCGSSRRGGGWPNSEGLVDASLWRRPDGPRCYGVQIAFERPELRGRRPESAPGPRSRTTIRPRLNSWALSAQERKFRVNVLSPGPTETPGLVGAVGPDLRQFASEVPLGRIGHPDEIAAVATFLDSDASSFVNGADWFVDGGQAQV